MNKEKEDALFKLILCNNETHRFWLSDDERKRLEKEIKIQTEKLHNFWLSDNDIEEEIDLFLDTYLDY